MRIRTRDLTNYNSENLEELVAGCKRIGKLSYSLMDEGQKIAYDIVYCSDYIDTINFTAAKQNMINYLRLSKQCFDELYELEDSVVTYANLLCVRWHCDEFSVMRYEINSFNYSLLEGGTNDSNRGRVDDVNILNRLIDYVESFIDRIIALTNEISNVTRNLQDVWNDSQYNEFQYYIDEIMRQLKANANSVDLCVQSVKQELR